MICRLSSKANYCFRLQHPFTVLILLLFSFVTACELFLGNSFSCSTTDASVTSSYVEVSCYTSVLYTIPSAWKEAKQNLQRLSHITASSEDFPDRWRIQYYRWVYVVFLVQAFIFYLPHLLWSTYEKGFIKKLTSQFLYHNSTSWLLQEGKRNLHILANFLVSTFGKFSSYAFVHACCELLNHLASIVNILWLVAFFQITNVPEEIEDTVTLETWDDFASFYFPPFAKCSVPHLPKAGVSTRIEAICSLPLNNIYMYMFLFLFSWYVFLAVSSGLSIVMVFLKCCFYVRRFLLKASLSRSHSANDIVYMTSYSDFIVLGQIKKNLLPGQFELLVNEINRQLVMKDAIE